MSATIAGLADAVAAEQDALARHADLQAKLAAAETNLATAQGHRTVISLALAQGGPLEPHEPREAASAIAAGEALVAILRDGLAASAGQVERAAEALDDVFRGEVRRRAEATAAASEVAFREFERAQVAMKEADFYARTAAALVSGLSGETRPRRRAGYRSQFAAEIEAAVSEQQAAQVPTPMRRRA